MEDSESKRGQQVIGYNAAMIAIPTVAVMIRFWSRAVTVRDKQQRFWWDDWTALLALPLCITSNILSILIVNLGLNMNNKYVVHASDLTQDFKRLRTLFFALYLVYSTGLTLAKMSALFFLTTIFSAVSTKFNRAILVTHALVWMWWAGVTIGTILNCKPNAFTWNRNLGGGGGTCGQYEALWLGTAVPSVVIDLIILLLPLPLLWRLQITKARKVLIVGLFVCGYCVVCISIGRLVSILTSFKHPSKSLGRAMTLLYWIGAETPFTILSICLPSVFLLLRQANQQGIASLFGPRAKRSHVILYDTPAPRNRIGSEASGASSTKEDVRTTSGSAGLVV